MSTASAQSCTSCSRAAGRSLRADVLRQVPSEPGKTRHQHSRPPLRSFAATQTMKSETSRSRREIERRIVRGCAGSSRVTSRPSRQQRCKTRWNAATHQSRRCARTSCDTSSSCRYWPGGTRRPTGSRGSCGVIGWECLRVLRSARARSRSAGFVHTTRTRGVHRATASARAALNTRTPAARPRRWEVQRRFGRCANALKGN